jgi:hypothetical protein
MGDAARHAGAPQQLEQAIDRAPAVQDDGQRVTTRQLELRGAEAFQTIGVEAGDEAVEADLADRDQPGIVAPGGERGVEPVEIGVDCGADGERVDAERIRMAEAMCRPGEVVPLTFSIRGVARGTETVEPLYVAMTLFGLLERIVSAGEPAIVNVLPNLRAVGRMHRKLNDYALRSLGARTAPRIGKGRDFDRLRDYVRDDDYRDIAWRSSAIALWICATRHPTSRGFPRSSPRRVRSSTQAKRPS